MLIHGLTESHVRIPKATGACPVVAKKHLLAGLFKRGQVDRHTHAIKNPLGESEDAGVVDLGLLPDVREWLWLHAEGMREIDVMAGISLDEADEFHPPKAGLHGKLPR